MAASWEYDMPPIAHDIQQILDLAPQYSRDPTPAMLQRAEIGTELERELAAALEDMVDLPDLADLSLRVKAGGRESFFSPLPWVRVYSPRYAPSAYRGIYLVYLFAADGSCVYLSLNQGSSEYRTGFMRPVTDTRVLRSNAAQARSALGDLIESEGAAGTAMSINLARQAINSPHSKARARAYEDGNILAREYHAGMIPEDGQLLADLAGMLPPLAHLYGQTITPVSDDLLAQAATGASGLTGNRSGPAGQRHLTDSEVRKKVELYAEDRVVEDFTALGWTVHRVGRENRGYDLECTNDGGEILHIEVKGTQTRGEKVELTENEVQHNREAADCGADHALYVVTQIEVSREGGITCSGGEPNCLWPWTIDERDLSPTKYSYSVPVIQSLQEVVPAADRLRSRKRATSVPEPTYADGRKRSLRGHAQAR
jgi:hypothetical protein